MRALGHDLVPFRVRTRGLYHHSNRGRHDLIRDLDWNDGPQRSAEPGTK